MRNSAKIKIAMVTTALGMLATGCNGPCGPWPEGTDLDGDGYACEVDCQDFSAAIYPGAPELCDGWDNNCDGEFLWMEIDRDGDGYISCAGSPSGYDCAPTHPEVHPGAPELCDGMDNDCDPATPVWPGDDVDMDGDGAMACSDCDDSDPDVYPGRWEDCDGLDSDCDGIGDAWVFKRELNVASDGEEDFSVGFAANFYAIDESVALEGFAQRVSGFTTTWGVPSPRLLVYRWVGDEWTLLNATTLRAPTSGDWWRVQGDLGIPLEAGGEYLIGAAGFTGTTHAKLSLATAPEALPMGEALSGYAGPANMPLTFEENVATELPGRFAQSLVWREASEIDQDGDGILLCLDCNDAGAEICDGFDGDCDGSPDPSEVDNDLDGFVDCAGDCAPWDGDVAPHREELCDGFDSNCMPEGVSGGEFDLDGDGFAPCEGDCDDNDPNAYPGAPELCDDVDQDCDGDADDWRNDNDGDGVWDCFDCMPNYAGAAPGIEDTCTSMYDLNCDGVVGPGSDLDGDGVTDCEGDCDDDNPLVYPGMTEIDGDGVDNNCDGEVDGSAPAIRVSFDDLEVQTMESFWAPADIRRPRTRGDYAVFTRAADGTIVDFEALEYDPLLDGMEVAPVQTLSQATGEYQFSGTVWLDATDAVQVVVATLDPYEEIDVQLAPAVAPAPPAAGFAFGPSLNDCDALAFEASLSDVVAAMESQPYFPWIDFNDPAAYTTWAPYGAIDLSCDDAFSVIPTETEIATCQGTPSLDQLIATCKSLSLASPAVAASVLRVYFVSQVSVSTPGVSGAALPGGDMILSTDALNPDTNTVFQIPATGFVQLVAHEAAHIYMKSPNVQGGGPTLFPAGGPVEADYGQNPTEIGSAFIQLTDAANSLPEVSPACGSGTQYRGANYTAFATDAIAEACGFARKYGSKNEREDVATWVGETTVAAYLETSAAFCNERLKPTLEEIESGDLLNYGKLALLYLGGYLPPTLLDECLVDFFPWEESTSAARLWTIESDSGIDFDVVANLPVLPVTGELDLVSWDLSVPAVLHLEDGAFSSPSHDATFVQMNVVDPSYTWDYTVPPLGTATHNYLGRNQLPIMIPGPAEECFFTDNSGNPGNLDPGVYGRSFEGVALVIENSEQTLGFVSATSWHCAEPPVSPNVFSTPLPLFGDFESFPEISGATAAFQVPASLLP